MKENAEKILKDYQRKVFLESLNEDFRALQSDPTAWQEEQKERALWDNTLKDGLDEDSSSTRPVKAI